MIDVIIIGAGGHAAEIDEYISYSNKTSGIDRLKVIGFIDDNPDSYKQYKLSAPYLGEIIDHKIERGTNYLIGIANPKYRRIFIDKFVDEGAQFLSFIHSSAYVSESSVIGDGNIIGPNANIGPNVKIGNYNLINSRCSLGHDTVIGNYNFISPNTCFSGFTSMADDNLFGINCATIPGIKVGSRNKITAGMTLDQSIGDDTVVFFRYKERIIAIPK